MTSGHLGIGSWFLLLSLTLGSSLALGAEPHSSSRASSDQHVKPAHLDRKGEKWAAKTLQKMSLEQKIGQMIMVWAPVQFMNVNGPDYLALRDEMSKYHVGGFGITAMNDGPYILKNQPLEAAALTNQLQRDSKYPLLFAADFERGLSMRINGTTVFPHAMAFGASGDRDLAFQFGRISAIESRAIGVHWNWFPVADVNSNPANPIINTRSFGEDPNLVSDFVKTYIAGAHEEGMLTTVKHFPGHGDTDTDTHLTLARVNGNLERLNSVELVPFRSAIAAGVDSVMVAHVTVPAIEPDPNCPASISSHVVDGVLKHDLGFHGLVVTDGLNMGALTRVFSGNTAQISAKAAVAAVRAGNDMVIIPGDLDGAYHGLLEAVRRGEITEARIDESVLKILRVKASLNLHRERLVDLSAVSRLVTQPESVAVAQKVADKAITVVRDNHLVLPLKATATPTATGDSQQQQADPDTAVIVFTDDARSTEGGRVFGRQLRMRVPGATIFYVDESNAGSISQQVLSAVEQAREVVAVAEVIPSAGRTRRTNGQAVGSADLQQDSSQLLASVLQKAAAKTVVVAMGNPYIVNSMPEVQTYVCTFSNTPTSAISAVRALFGEIPVTGHTPVTIPGIAKRGQGLELTPTSSAKIVGQ
jgi:beta-N-acetylhexosaminidase